MAVFSMGACGRLNSVADWVRLQKMGRQITQGPPWQGWGLFIARPFCQLSPWRLKPGVSWLHAGADARGDRRLQVVPRGDQRPGARRNEAGQALIVLPAPEVLQPRVDHRRSKTWEVRRMTWLPWNADQDRLRDEVMLQAQKLVARAAGSIESVVLPPISQGGPTGATPIPATSFRPSLYGRPTRRPGYDR